MHKGHLTILQNSVDQQKENVTTQKKLHIEF